jgi:hypothetical protein
MMPSQFYLWIIVCILLSGFIGALWQLWTHDCRKTLANREYGKGPHGD